MRGFVYLKKNLIRRQENVAYATMTYKTHVHSQWIKIYRVELWKRCFALKTIIHDLRGAGKNGARFNVSCLISWNDQYIYVFHVRYLFWEISKHFYFKIKVRNQRWYNLTDLIAVIASKLWRFPRICLFDFFKLSSINWFKRCLKLLEVFCIS